MALQSHLVAAALNCTSSTTLHSTRWMRDGDQWHYLYQLLFNVVHVEVRLSLCVYVIFFNAYYVVC